MGPGAVIRVMKAGNTERTKVDQKTGSSSFSCRVGSIISFRGVPGGDELFVTGLSFGTLYLTYWIFARGLTVATDSSAKKKCRQYSVEYLAYGFIPAPQNPSMAFCLNCTKMVSNESMIPSKMKKHLESAYADKKDKPLEYYQNLRNNFEKRMTLSKIVTERSKKLDKGTIAS
ncbi:hypothetical protein M514_26641 [Trichuris suis]|uniref:BED-type domain-containing protein n=1 Tax=Trichuris suis TaxID=68888 RepID=A0A085MVA8_9BILA|nr:hypothetical protein M514_26641 [Trichuris suis]